jgi:hypothetical protein
LTLFSVVLYFGSGYLALYTLGTFTNSVGTIELSACKQQDSTVGSCCLKELFEMLGVEFIVLWNAMLLKKRVLVVCEQTEGQSGTQANLQTLMDTMLTLPQLVWHRKDFSILRPLVRADSTNEHLEDLTSSGVFAGTVGFVNSVFCIDLTFHSFYSWNI